MIAIPMNRKNHISRVVKLVIDQENLQKGESRDLTLVHAHGMLIPNTHIIELLTSKKLLVLPSEKCVHHAK